MLIFIVFFKFNLFLSLIIIKLKKTTKLKFIFAFVIIALISLITIITVIINEWMLKTAVIFLVKVSIIFMVTGKVNTISFITRIVKVNKLNKRFFNLIGTGLIRVSYLFRNLKVYNLLIGKGLINKINKSNC